MNNNTEGDFEVSQDTEPNYVETVNVSLVEQQLNNSNSSSSAVEAAGQLRSNNGSFKVPLDIERGREVLIYRFLSGPTGVLKVPGVPTHTLTLWDK